THQFRRCRSICKGPSRPASKLARLFSTSGEAENHLPLARNCPTHNPRLVYLGAAHIENTRHERGSGGSSVLLRRLLAKLDVDLARFCPILPDRSQQTAGGCHEVAVHSYTTDKRQ